MELATVCIPFAQLTTILIVGTELEESRDETSCIVSGKDTEVLSLGHLPRVPDGDMKFFLHS